MNTPLGHEKLDHDTLARIESVLHLREAVSPDPRRVEMIRGIQAAVQGEAAVQGARESAAEALEALEALASLERTSLGTPDARRVRSTAAPSGIADILDRHEKSCAFVRPARTPDHHGAGPTVVRIMLGYRLRRLREDNLITATEAGDAIRASISKISRIELGRVGIKYRDLLDLMALYGTGPEERAQLLELAQQANQPGWWHAYADILPDWFDFYLGLESAATLIRVHEPRYVPDLLQTPEYAAEIIAPARLSPDETERRLLFHRERRRRFEEGKTGLWAVIDEGALRRQVGGRRVLIEQLRYLLDVTEAPHVRLQVIPLHTGYARAGAFSMLRVPEPDMPDIVYMDNLTCALYLEKQADIDQYQRIMEQLSATGTDPDETRRILTTIIRQLGRRIG